ncbi:unnamed protein product [Aspergillus oryzae var. brunneus]|uniref:Unnamed protein product n=1 Tax=Aspergillus oryzae var. brunneus TaxID=332754 RepID=A0ABQ6KMD7_ASPOZ|nr:unnamed protein product [Aspergillus oryzae var. brunneus]
MYSLIVNLDVNTKESFLISKESGASVITWPTRLPSTISAHPQELLPTSPGTQMPTTGFLLEFKRNYDFATEDRKYQIMPLVDVEERYVADTVGDGKMSCDTTARDRLESVATVVKPPGPSREPSGKDVCVSCLSIEECLLRNEC